MHEMSLAQNILDIARQELQARGCTRLTGVHLRCGALAGVEVSSLRFGFEVLLQGTPDETARLEIEEVPLRLRCGVCGAEFGGEGRLALWEPCPFCGEQLGHEVLQGKELNIVAIEGT